MTFTSLSIAMLYRLSRKHPPTLILRHFPLCHCINSIIELMRERRCYDYFPSNRKTYDDNCRSGSDLRLVIKTSGTPNHLQT